MKGTGEASDWQQIDQWDDGVGWIAYPDEDMQRASHALVDEGDVWLVDPVDADGLDEMLDDLGTVAGVVVLLNRHKRDAAELARRHDVPVSVPDFMTDVPPDLDAPVETVHRELGDTDYAIHELIDNRLWKEAVLYGEESGTLVVPEAVGTSHYFRADDERLGVHPVLRLKPPRKLGRLSPERIRVGHGRGIASNADAILDDALDGSRRRAPGIYARTLKEVVL